MSSTMIPRTTEPSTPARSSLAALARADSRRFARHPLFLFGVAVCLLLLASAAIGGDPAPLESTVVPAFFLGVFGFVVAHRLTTSLRRSPDLAEIAPVDQRRRTVSLCLACLVPTAAAVVMMAVSLVAGAVWPPVAIPAGDPVSWFGHEPAIDILAALAEGGPVAALGGSLLGVAVARWLPFRGSALLALVVLVGGTAMASDWTSRWAAIAPYQVFSESLVVDGQIRSSWLAAWLSARWHLAYALCLCALAVAAALLRDDAGRRQQLAVSAALTVAAAGALLLAVR